MKIAVTGTQSTGKTTLVNAVARSTTERIYCIQEVARSVIASGYPLGKDGGVSAYSCFYITQTKFEEMYDPRSSPHLLSDRCLIDLLAHGRVNARQKFTKWPKEYLEMIEVVTRQRCSFYDRFVYLPIEFEQKNDGIREEDTHYRAEVGDEILSIIDDWQLNAMVLTGPLDKRKQELIAEMTHYEKIQA